MTQVWPYILTFSSLSFSKSGASVTGGRTLAGSEFVVRSDAGFWRATGTVAIRGRERHLAYQALMAGLDGMAGDVLVPCYSRYRPVDYNGRRFSASMATGESLTDHTGFGAEETPVMWTAALGVRRSTRLTISHPQVPALQAGQFFGLGDRLYQVRDQWQTELETVRSGGGELVFGGVEVEFNGQGIVLGAPAVTRSGSNLSEIEFWPPLRDTVSGGSPLILGRPVCKMRLASDEVGAIDHVALTTTANLDFAEVI